MTSGMGWSSSYSNGVDLALVEELLLLVAELADDLLAKLESLDHVLFGDLVGAGLDHLQVVLGARDGQVEVGVLVFLEGRIDDVLARLAVAADADAGNGAVKRRAADHQRSGGAHRSRGRRAG